MKYIKSFNQLNEGVSPAFIEMGVQPEDVKIPPKEEKILRKLGYEGEPTPFYADAFEFLRDQRNLRVDTTLYNPNRKERMYDKNLKTHWFVHDTMSRFAEYLPQGYESEYEAYLPENKLKALRAAIDFHNRRSAGKI